jgi:hypothetical protein
MPIGSRVVEEAEFRKIPKDSLENTEGNDGRKHRQSHERLNGRKVEIRCERIHGKWGYFVFSSISIRFSSKYFRNDSRRKNQTYAMKRRMKARNAYPM